jgi:hypothetical protein
MNIAQKTIKNGGTMTSKIIKQAVESAFNSFIDIKTRRRDITYMRAIYYKLCKEFTFEPLHQIGKTVNRDHATVIHGLKTFDNIIDNFWEKEYFNIYLDIKKHIKNKISLEVKSYDPNKFYRNKYRVKLLQNKQLYNYTKQCIDKLEEMDYKYCEILRNQLNNIASDKKYVTK